MAFTASVNLGLLTRKRFKTPDITEIIDNQFSQRADFF